MPNVECTPLFGATPRLPPSNVPAEQALLGSLLTNNARTADRCEFLKPEHFADPINARIYERAMARIAAGQVADPVVLKSDFENTGNLDEVGGTKYLVSLISAGIGWLSAGEYARTIYDTWLRRELIYAGEDVTSAAYGDEPGADVQKMLDHAAERFLALGEHSSDQRGIDFATAAKAAVERTAAAQRGDAGQARLDTGIASVDGLWNGLWPGQLYFLMARSRTGKTPFMMQIARHVAGQLAKEAEETQRPPEHVHLFSLEMSAADLLTINLASVTRWSADEIRSGRVGGDKEGLEWMAFEAAAAQLGKLPIVIDDQADTDLPGLAMRARATKRKKRTRLILIDYREMIRRGREQARMQLPEWVPFLGYQLKALAKALDVPIVALAQINKTKSGDVPVRPTLDDLPYDGGQAADAVFALHRPELYMPINPPQTRVVLSEEKQKNAASAWEAERNKVRGMTEFIGLKRRFGPTGSPCKLRFNGPRMLLSEWSDEPPAQPPLPQGRFDDMEGVD